jgi:hypothetical protein
MSGRRIARRVALRVRSCNPCVGAISAGTLATKVCDYQLQSFSLMRGGRLDRGQAGGWVSTGVRPCPGRGGARRVGWRGRPVATPFVTSTLVTKDRRGGSA